MKIKYKRKISTRFLKKFRFIHPYSLISDYYRTFLTWRGSTRSILGKLRDRYYEVGSFKAYEV